MIFFFGRPIGSHASSESMKDTNSPRDISSPLFRAFETPSFPSFSTYLMRGSPKDLTISPTENPNRKN